MIPNLSRAVTALGALALAQSTLAIDFVQTDLNPLQCGTDESCSYLAAPVQAKSAPSESVQGLSADLIAAKQQQLFEWLHASAAPVEKAAFRVELTRQDLRDIGEADAGGLILRPDPRRFQVGVDKEVGHYVSFDALQNKRLSDGVSHEGGTVVEGLDGELVWTARAHSKGATALRIGLEELDLPAGAELFVYSERGEAFGPYTGQGPTGSGSLWTNTIMGDTVTLQLHYFGARDADSLAALGFRIGSISHIGPRFPLADMIAPDQSGDKLHCSYNASCVEPGQAFAGAEDAVALLIFNSGGGTFICSGGLLTDTDNGTLIPHFLTANHCIGNGSEAASLETVFDFNGDCSTRYGNGNYPNRTNGSTIQATGGTSDYTLLELSSNPGGSRVYLGWNNSPVAFNNGANLFRISHPAGAPQAYSEHDVDTSKPTCGSWPRGSWIYSRDTFGATEGGSSGSPVLNASGQVVGQLTGACGFNVGNVCDAAANATVDGAFAAYWPAVQPFLDPGGGPSCKAKGESCTSDSECCSNKCKGRTGRKTCK